MIRVTRTMAQIGRVGVCVCVRMAQGKKLVVSLEVWHLIDLSGWDARGHLWWPVGRRSWQWSPGVEEGSQWFFFFLGRYVLFSELPHHHKQIPCNYYDLNQTQTDSKPTPSYCCFNTVLTHQRPCEPNCEWSQIWSVPKVTLSKATRVQDNCTPFQ